MHGSLPAVLQHGTVVSASKLHETLRKEVYTIEHAHGIRIQKSAGRGRGDSKHRMNRNKEHIRSLIGDNKNEICE
jgi:hypothetical protein